MARLAPWLWALAGAMIGVGTLFSGWFWQLVALATGQRIQGTNAGWPLVALGAALALVLLWRGHGRGAWAGLVGLGAVPAALTIYASMESKGVCGPPAGVTVPNMHCAYYGPPWYTSLDARLGFAFVAVALVGALIPLLAIRPSARSATRPPARRARGYPRPNGR